MLKLIAAGLLMVTGCSVQKQQEQATSVKTPDEIGQLGAHSWAAFECAAIAMSAEQDGDLKRLFGVGHRDGLEFIEAAQAHKDQQREIMDKVPLIMVWELEGPSPDFMLGRVWKATTEYVDDEINGRDSWNHQVKDPKAPQLDKELLKLTAKNRFREHNCELI